MYIQATDVSMVGSVLPPRAQSLARCEPYNIYDYLRIKDRAGTPNETPLDGQVRHEKKRLRPQEKGETPLQSLQRVPSIPADFAESQVSI